MPLLILEADVRELLTMGDALALVEEAFGYAGSERPSEQPRRRVASGQGTLNVMSAAVPARDAMGLKAYPVSPGGATFTILLYRASTGQLLAIVEAGWLGALRTGAASGVATCYLARPDARTMGLFGAGAQARTQLLAVAPVRDLERVAVYARDADAVRRFCTELSAESGVPVEPAPPEEVAARDIVTTATSSPTPVLGGRDLATGAHVNAIGSNFASKSEIDLEVVRRAALVVADSLDSARLEGGDLLPAVDRGLLAWEHVVELGDIVSGRVGGRGSDEEVSLFASHGVAREDIVLAHEVFVRAEGRGRGIHVPMFALERPVLAPEGR